ncbi:hypothetical protein LX97_02010 [Nonlabens dokdonensis]|uniref:Uncharacterized protein n=2 Tax=Nonlabens dokdonensis TaxID=328515 RepID=L7WD25_NONDD|nr:hypothetical protein [Nonlabens dokdonensis]AGC77811.1 hypothetical protein DDD_2684 [Nonlabens dokdonensis DSW-6]PZX39656.1 hypothetical protein LX97_02010 [Nonlabens dokdonensis]
MSIDWDAIAQQAGQQTDQQFHEEIAKLTSMNMTEIDKFITASEISNENAVKVIKEINDATRSNNDKANAIANIDKGVGFLVSLVSKVV